MTRVSKLLRVGLIMLACGAADSHAATTAALDSARNQALAWLLTNQLSAGEWQSPAGVPIQTTATVVDALTQVGINHGYYYAGGIAWLRNAEPQSTDALARQIATLGSTGVNVGKLVNSLLTNRENVSKTWGAYYQYQGSFPDTALVIDAFVRANASYADFSTTLNFITGQQHTDGGWPYSAQLSANSLSQLIPTSFATIALSRAKTAGWSTDSYITKAVNWIVAQKKADNGFAEDSTATSGSEFESALVNIALYRAQQAGNSAAIAAQPTIDAVRDFLLSRQQSDGSWQDDTLVTALVIQALPPVTLADADNDGVPDAVETLLGTNATVADGRNTVGNGAGQAGVQTPLALPEQFFGGIIDLQLEGIGSGTWSLLSGSLPEGVTLNSSTGKLNGKPTVAGTFNFSYQLVDGGGQVLASNAAQLIVSDATQVPVLPLWAAAVMVLVLVFIAYRRRPNHHSVHIR